MRVRRDTHEEEDNRDTMKETDDDDEYHNDTRMRKSAGKAVRAVVPFINGGLAGIGATIVIQPIDMIKVRVQLGGVTSSSDSAMAIARRIVSSEGVAGLYRGISAAVFRQATYTTARLGIFTSLMAHLRTQNDGNVGLGSTMCAGVIAGGIGSLIGSPADLTLIRMQADHTLPPEQRRHYRNIFHALHTIAKTEGIVGLFRGASSTSATAMALNCGMLASNERVKDALDEFSLAPRGSAASTLTASVIAGFVASIVSLPFDYVKTQMQKQLRRPDGSMPYRNVLDCAVQSFAAGGVRIFFKGWRVWFSRIAPHAVLSLVFLDCLTSVQKRYELV